MPAEKYGKEINKGLLRTLHRLTKQEETRNKIKGRNTSCEYNRELTEGFFDLKTRGRQENDKEMGYKTQKTKKAEK